MKRILIISMSRMGDLLQVVPVLKALKENNTEKVFISVLVRKKFSAVVKNISYIDDLIVFDTKEIVNKSIFGGISAYREILENFINDLNERHYDEIINLTFSQVSAYITYLVDAKVKKGLNFSNEGKSYYEDLWSNFFNGVVLNRTINTMNLVDIFFNIAGVKSSCELIKLPQTASYDLDDFNAAVNLKSYVIVYQMGASTENKRWPVRSFATLTKLILTSPDFSIKDLKIVLIGSLEEKSLSDEFKFLIGNDIVKDNIVDLIGKTQTQALWTILKRADVFITNDTGSMHIATLCKTPIVNISLGAVNFHETGPYCTNSIVITPKIKCYPCSFTEECTNQKCKMYIKPKDVLEAIKTLDELCISNQKVFNDVGKNISGYSNFFYSQQIYRADSPRRIELIPLNKIKLTDKLLSEIICNMALNAELTFDIEAFQRISQRIQKYDTKGFNSNNLKITHDTLKDLKKLVKSAENINSEIEYELSNHNAISEEYLADAIKKDKDLFELDVKIASFQTQGELFKYILGIFLSLKANNQGTLLIRTGINKFIYKLLTDSIEALVIICNKVYIEFNNSYEMNLNTDIVEGLQGKIMETYKGVTTN